MMMNIQALMDSQYSFLSNEFSRMDESMSSENQKYSTKISPQSFGHLQGSRSDPGLSSFRLNDFLDTSPSSGLHFPFKLHHMLADVAREGRESIVSWDGLDGFKVHDKTAFEKEIAPRYFNHSKYRSFQRMLNMWGFERIRSGPRQGVYTNINFRRGEPNLCRAMKCEKIKSRQTSPPKRHSSSFTYHSEMSSATNSPTSSTSGVISFLRRDSKPNMDIDSFEGKQFHVVKNDGVRNDRFFLAEEPTFHNPIHLVDHDLSNFKLLSMSSLSLMDALKNDHDD